MKEGRNIEKEEEGKEEEVGRVAALFSTF